jgi:uncharacterized protein YdaU (DUF1376 family)
MGIESWMPLYTADVLASCADMSPSQFGSYMRLLCYAWQSGGLPNDMEACCRIAGGCTPGDWSAVRKRLVVLDEGTSDERLSHPRLEAERAKASVLHKKRVEAMTKARAANPKNRDQSIDQSSDQSIDQSIDTQPQLQPQPQPPIKNATPTELLGVTRQKPRRTYRIAWTAEAGFHGVTDDDLARWKAAYPGVNLTQETAKAHAWLVDNPAKGGKRNWAAFLNRWFGRVQDKGGTAGQPAAPSKKFRPDAGREMTATEYRQWKDAQDRREWYASQSAKRSGMVSLGDAIHERTGTDGPPAG